MSLKSDLENRFSCYFDPDNTHFEPIYIVAAALDPNTINLLDSNEFKLAESLIKAMLQKNVPSQSSQNNNDCQTSSSLLRGFVAKMCNVRREDREKISGTVKVQNTIHSVLQYLANLDFNPNVPTDTIKFWKKVLREDYTQIKKLALDVLSVPSTSAPSERVFSQAGFGTRMHRNRTKLDFLNSQLFVYLNKEW